MLGSKLNHVSKNGPWCGIGLVWCGVVFVLYGDMHLITSACDEYYRWNFNELTRNRNYISKQTVSQSNKVTEKIDIMLLKHHEISLRTVTTDTYLSGYDIQTASLTIQSFTLAKANPNFQLYTIANPRK